MNINNIVITSHSKRIRKFIDDYFPNFNKNKRIMNCGILLLSNDIYNDNIVNIKMIYQGESDPQENRKKENYYTPDDFNNLNLTSKTLIIPPNINIILIRHAQGYHNLNNTLFKKIMAINNNEILKDPQLTDVGIKQASNAGIFLKNNYPFILNNSIFCCSILLRTRETMSLILKELNIFGSTNMINLDNNINNQQIYVLPSSHEISNFIMPEKFVIKTGQCNNKVTNRLLYKCDFINHDDGIHNFNWDYYSKYKNNNSLKHINMIYESYLICAYLLKKDDNYVNSLRVMFEYQ